MSEWISVNYQLPSQGEDVWIAFINHFGGEEVIIGWLSDKYGWNVFQYTDPYDLETLHNKVTHWMPINVPDYPKEQL